MDNDKNSCSFFAPFGLNRILLLYFHGVHYAGVCMNHHGTIPYAQVEALGGVCAF